MHLSGYYTKGYVCDTLTCSPVVRHRNSRIGHRRGGTHRYRRDQLGAGLWTGRLPGHVQRHPGLRRQQPYRQPSQVRAFILR